MFQRTGMMTIGASAAQSSRGGFKARAFASTAVSAMALTWAGAAGAQTVPPATQTPAGPTAGADNTNGAAPQSAPTPQSSADAKAPAYGTEIVVTGTRAPGRSRLDTA